jgi:hypothetical protein
MPVFAPRRPPKHGLRFNDDEVAPSACHHLGVNTMDEQRFRYTKRRGYHRIAYQRFDVWKRYANTKLFKFGEEVEFVGAFEISEEFMVNTPGETKNVTIFQRKIGRKIEFFGIDTEFFSEFFLPVTITFPSVSMTAPKQAGTELPPTSIPAVADTDAELEAAIQQMREWAAKQKKPGPTLHVPAPKEGAITRMFRALNAKTEAGERWDW